jgi:hypothetical protein
MANAFQNPFLTPPQVPGPQSRSWGFGFAFGFKGPARSSMTPADIQPEDADAFDQGVLAGQNAAIGGIALSQTCVNLHAEGGIGPHLLLEVPEGVMWIADITEGLAGGIAGTVLFFINLSIALETFTDDPDKRLSEAANSLKTQIHDMGFEESMEMFIGGGVDISASGCELKLTPIFATNDAAVEAAKALQRPHWLVASWRTDQSGGARVVAQSD